MTWPRLGVIGLRWGVHRRDLRIADDRLQTLEDLLPEQVMIILYGSITSTLSTTSRKNTVWNRFDKAASGSSAQSRAESS